MALSKRKKTCRSLLRAGRIITPYRDATLSEQCSENRNVPGLLFIAESHPVDNGRLWVPLSQNGLQHVFVVFQEDIWSTNCVRTLSLLCFFCFFLLVLATYNLAICSTISCYPRYPATCTSNQACLATYSHFSGQWLENGCVPVTARAHEIRLDISTIYVPEVYRKFKSHISKC